jgi:RNA polymerase sigma factor (TIGR02999 family)
MSEVTRILNAIEAGDPKAAEQLFPLVYDELRQLAAAQMAREKPGQTLDATTLVHEAWLRLAPDAKSKGAFENRRHFFGAAAGAMRRILIDNARRKKSLKRGGAAERVALPDLATPDADDQLVALDEALTRLEGDDSIAARVVELRHFAGLVTNKSPKRSQSPSISLVKSGPSLAPISRRPWPTLDFASAAWNRVSLFRAGLV